MVSEMISLKPVIEVPYGPLEIEFAWEIVALPQGCFLPLSDQLALSEIGFVVAILMDYNHVATLADVLNAEALLLPGGIGVFKDDQPHIMPGCCCGLESWREWEEFAETERSPWCGHDPEAILRKSEGRVSIEQKLYNETRHAELALSDYIEELKAVEKSLQGFVFSLEAWVSAVGFSEPGMLATKFNECFDIKARW